DTALIEANAATAEIAAGRRLGPLHGIPFAIKDLYETAGVRTTAGSPTRDQYVPAEDAHTIALLKQAGIVMLGKLTLHEWAMGGTNIQAWYATPHNPWDTTRVTGGSSGGSGAAVAAGLCFGSLGTDTRGSIRIPAAACGITGLKPTYGRVSIRGIIPLSWSLDHSGPMARTVEDCAILLAGMAGDDRPVAAAPLAGARLGVLPADDLDPDVAAGFDSVLDLCRRLGAELVQAPPVRPSLDDWGGIFDVDVYAFHRRFDDHRELYRPSTREFVEGGAGADASRYDELQARREQDAAEWEDWLAAERAAALLQPTVPDVAWLRGRGYDHAGSDVRLIELTHHWDWTGQPVVALPAGLGARSGLPVGVSLSGPRGSDRELLALGIALQAELGVPALP
ncbi:MAG: amidase, partial [Gaiellaceae bacterium]